MMNRYPRKRKRQPVRNNDDESFSYDKIWWPLLVNLLLPVCILAALLLLPALFITIMAG